MQITQLTTASVTLTTDTTILDRGEVTSCDISVSPGVSLHYVFVGDNDNAYTREFHLAEGAQFQ